MATRKKKPASERHNKVVSTSHTAAQLRQLKELADAIGLGVSSYASRVLHSHIDDPKAIKQFRRAYEASKDKLSFITPLDAYAKPKAVEINDATTALLDGAERSGAKMEAALKALLSRREHGGDGDEAFDVARFAGKFEAALHEQRMHASWARWTAGLVPVGDRYSKYEAAWIAGDADKAKGIARETSWQEWSLGHEPTGNPYAAFEAAWMADDYAKAAEVARDANDHDKLANE